MTSHTPDGPLTAAQLRRRTERAASPRRTEPTPTSTLTGPSVGSWTAPPGKPGSWLRQAWHRQQADKARAEAVRKREQEDRKLGARLAAHRVQKNAEAAKQRRIASVIANPSRKNITAVTAAKAGRKASTRGKTRGAVAGRGRSSMADLAALMRSRGLHDGRDVYDYLASRGMSQADIGRLLPSLSRGAAPGAGLRIR
ncbi:hypothetical protein ACFUTY_22395 [Streptomyces sp. NPDC057362]|uniref:hypothetical protein n=1 Tax=Streptomyces sp. NPDC057362 TaxID=3346106 RepID=UPI003625C6A8